MNRIFIDIGIVLAFFVGMEAVAWLAHKYLMHGLLWSLHADHHQKEQDGFLEKNDFFFLIFATPGIACLLVGVYMDKSFFLMAGLGITLYGMCYFFIHDLFIHQRIKVLRNSQHWYLKAIRRAHKMHHKHLHKHDGECFGMLWVPLKYYREAKKAKDSV
ncbi:sterol desaturase family protein [Mucilaginibacter myungsuensis]|uniref:Sterol desaturase family protein n=2 Tax=Mucilaginibacter myungsuensis TaxID=649104 RepID=A0A929KYS2_9SPHI|nr:sterol desaturase family protein [Mucilaginibacter myungsuensis]